MSTSSLLRAKLRAPVTSDRYVRRGRLLTLLDAATTAPLTVISAPAGSGKTTLAAGWVEESSIRTAWVSLDNTDRDARQFWASVIAAIQVLAPACGARATLALRGGAPIPETVGHLLDDLDADGQAQAVLIIDDLHLVDDEPAVASSLALFAQHLPTWLHLVLSSRRDPELPKERMRARGQLADVRFPELRFSPEEARELMSRLDAPLSDDGIETVAARADGWAAGLQLAALAARSESAQSGYRLAVSDDRLLVQDYILREVLAAEAPELVEALTDISVVERVSPRLAHALTKRDDAEQLLDRAESRGLFLTRIDPEGWFEVHSLVRATLTAELGSRSPSRLHEQHARAAQWFEQAGEVPLALDHWLAADRAREALRLLAAKHADLYDSGREATVERVIAAIPSEIVSADLQSMIEYAWCHLLVNRRRFVELVEQAAWAGSETTEVNRARLTMLQSIAATMTGYWVDGGALARRAMKDFGDSWWQDPLGRFGWNMIAREVALSERWDDADGEVREAALALGRDPSRRLAFEGTRALGEVLAGRPVDALRVAAGARRAATVGNMTILRAELAVAEAMAHREIGDRPRAVLELVTLAEAPSATMLYCRLLACVELVQARIDEGDLDAARAALGLAESLIEGESFGPDGRDWLTRVRTQLALAAGEVDDARQRARLIVDPLWHGVNVARVHLAEGHRGNARAVLKPLAPRCVRHEVVLALLRAKASDDRETSTKYATVAVEQAAASGLLQTVASEGSEIVELVERAAWRVPPTWIDRFRRAAGSGGAWPGPAKLIEPLTERERDVLRFLPSRLTVREIADELCVSVNTLKFHLKVIYRKLGVSSRAEAAEAARHTASGPRST
jgi:LuxR family maltose regulon positive regulatory protein